MTTDQPTTPPTAAEALEILARRLDAQAPDATWLPPSSVAELVREFAATIPADPERSRTTSNAEAGPEPDLRLTANGSAGTSGAIRLGGTDVAKWVTRADLRLDANSYGPPTLCLELDVPGVVAELRTVEVNAAIDPTLAELLKAAGWAEPDRGPF